MELLKVQHGQIITASGNPIRLRGWNIGGWLNMEDLIDLKYCIENKAITEVLKKHL